MTLSGNSFIVLSFDLNVVSSYMDAWRRTGKRHDICYDLKHIGICCEETVRISILGSAVLSYPSQPYSHEHVSTVVLSHMAESSIKSVDKYVLNWQEDGVIDLLTFMIDRIAQELGKGA